MPQTCSVCRSPDRDAIDRALVAGEALRDIAGRFGPAKSAVARHKDHLPGHLRKAAEAEDVARAIDVVGQLRAINGASLAVLREARDRRDGDLALKAVDRIQKQIELQAKLLGDLDERPTVNVAVLPEWVAARAALLVALRPYPEARVAVAEALAALGGGA